MDRTITICHSPDSDDAFMFYALTQGKIPTDGLRIGHELRDIETLNQWAMQGKSEVSALSFHAYAHVADRYALLDSGASIGHRYGPIVVAKRPYSPDALAKLRIAVPGRYTSALLFLQLWNSEIRYDIYDFNDISRVINEGKADAGLIIHEGQLTYAKDGFVKVLDLGEWWFQQTGLPLPLGGNVVRRDLGMDLMAKIARLQRQSIVYALAHRDEAMDFAIRYARDLDKRDADRFVGMYVNERTVRYGDDDKEAIRLMFQMAYDKKLIPALPALDFVSDETQH